MKNPKTYLPLLAVAAGTVAIITLGTQLKAADGGMPSCCSAMSGMNTPASDANTNALPDQLKTCPISGEKLAGAMGKPFVFVYQGQQVKLGCPGCKKDFDKDPAKCLKLIRAADKK